MKKTLLSLILAMALTNLAACNPKSATSDGGSPSGPTETGPVDTGGKGGGDSEDGPGSGNGGKGVIIDGKPYLLDLVEAGLEKTVWTNPNVKTYPVVRERIAKILGASNAFPVDLVAQKMTEILERDYHYGIMLLKGMELFEWRLVSLPPKLVNDQREGVDVKADQYVQIAKRLHHSIIFDTNLYPQMDEWNRAATVIHEATYAVAQPIKLASGSFTQDVGAVQEFTAAVFSAKIAETNLFYHVVARIFPQDDNFGGDIMVSEDIFRSQLATTPDFEFAFLNKLNDIENTKPVYSKWAGFLASSGGAEAYKEDAIQSVCKLIPNESGFILYAKAQVPWRQYWVDFYEGAEGGFHSYVTVRKWTANSKIWTPDSPKDYVTKENCHEQMGKAFDSLAGYIKSDFKPLKTAYQ